MSAIPERLTAALADRYRIERELGQGGMARVYLAHDLKHDRLVATKVLRPAPRRERQQGTSESTTDGTSPRGG